MEPSAPNQHGNPRNVGMLGSDEGFGINIGLRAATVDTRDHAAMLDADDQQRLAWMAVGDERLGTDRHP